MPRKRKMKNRARGESRQKSSTLTAKGGPICKIDTIIGGPYVRGNTQNAQRNYKREANDPSMTSYFVNRSQVANRMAPITFSQDDARGVHYPHYDVLVVRAIVAWDGLKHMLVDNESSMNILFRSTVDKMQIKHGLVPMTNPLYEFTGDSIVPQGQITLAVEMRSAPWWPTTSWNSLW